MGLKYSCNWLISAMNLQVRVGQELRVSVTRAVKYNMGVSENRGTLFGGSLEGGTIPVEM